MSRRYRVTVSRGIAGRTCDNDQIEEWERPRFGFYWWLWMPSLSWNGGRFHRKEIVDVGITWLCFWFGFIFWPNHEKIDNRPKGSQSIK